MTRRTEDYLRGILYVTTALLVLGAAGICAHLFVYRPEPLVIQWAEPPQTLGQKTDAPEAGSDPMILKLAASHMSKAVVQPVHVLVKPPAPSLAILLRVKGIMEFGDPTTSEAIIESVRSNSTKNYKIDEHVEGVDAKVLKIDKVVTFLYDGKETQLGINAEVGIELPVAGWEHEPALSENRLMPQNK